MDRIFLKVIAVAVLGTVVCSTAVGAPCVTRCPFPGDVRDAIRAAIDAEGAGLREDLRRVYEPVAHQSLWLVNGRLTRQGKQVLEYISGIETRGLRPSFYGAAELRSVVNALDASATPEAQLGQVDLMLSREVLHVLRDLHQGRVDPSTLGLHLSPAGTLDLPTIVVDVSRASEVAPVIESVEPPYPEYAALISALSRYRAIDRDTHLTVPEDPGHTVKPGEPYGGARDLAYLLAALGDLASPVPNGQWYDSSVVAGVVAFQRRHGLEPDGLLGRATMAALRVPVGERIRQIELALERWRWLPHNPPDRYVMVNVPEFRLRAFDRQLDARSPVLTLNVIVGSARGRRHTPVFMAAMRSVVFHPYWDVPRSIARNELLPLNRRKPAYLTSGGFEIVEGSGANLKVVPLTADNLARVATGTSRIRQRPGAGNALGRVKLVFPNPYGVFLHDTPDPTLFARVRRDFSHGCVRVEQPGSLAEFALAGQGDWDADAVRAALEETRTQTVAVSRPLTVFVHYITARVNEGGVVHFFPDLYERDSALKAALARTDAVSP